MKCDAMGPDLRWWAYIKMVQSGHPLRCTLFCEGQIAAFKGQIVQKYGNIAEKSTRKIGQKNAENAGKIENKWSKWLI